MRLPETVELVEGEQKASVELGAEDAVQLELTDAVSAIDQTIPTAPAGVETANHDVTMQPREFALNAVQRGPKIQNQVVPLVIQRPRDSYRPLGAFERDCRLGNETLLIGRQHRQRR
jgi:hypothetical protein